MKQAQRPLGRPRLKEHTLPTNIAILQTATHLFVQFGFKNVSMDDVAAACNVTKATVYYYYKTKADLFTAAIVELMQRIKINTQNILVQNKPFKERLIELTATHIQATVDLDVNNFIREAAPNLSAEQLKEIQQSEFFMHATIEKIFENEMHEGNIPFSNIPFITHAYLSLLSIGKQGTADVKEAAYSIVEFFWNGLFTSTTEK